MDISDVAASPTDAPVAAERPSISVLSIRRRYWEMTHGWTVPGNPAEAPDVTRPGRVA